MAAGRNRLSGRHACQMVAAAEALDRIIRKPQPGGNRTIAKTFHAPEPDFFFFSVSHSSTASFEKSGPEGPHPKITTINPVSSKAARHRSHQR